VTTSTDHALLVQGASSERIGEIAFAAGVPVHELVNDGGALEDIFRRQGARSCKPCVRSSRTAGGRDRRDVSGPHEPTAAACWRYWG
jgi:hypothetical protein